MKYLIKFIDPSGTVTYWPKGFGFESHAHITDPTAAEQFNSPEQANRNLSGYIKPAAFWNSEREHKAAMEKKFRGWKFEVIPA